MELGYKVERAAASEFSTHLSSVQDSQSRKLFRSSCNEVRHVPVESLRCYNKGSMCVLGYEGSHFVKSIVPRGLTTVVPNVYVKLHIILKRPIRSRKDFAFTDKSFNCKLQPFREACMPI